MFRLCFAARRWLGPNRTGRGKIPAPAMTLPERLSVVMSFRRAGARLHFELWTTPVGDQVRSYLDGTETYARIVRDGEGTIADELLSLRAHALADGWIEEPLAST